MREILFKAKRKDNDKWVEGYYVYCRKRHYILPVLNKAIGFDEREEEWIEIALDTLSQYTGLADRNGNKIWENDILHRAYYTKDDCIVEWHDGCYRLKTIYGSYMQDPMTFLSLCFTEKNVQNLKVIGNIFDNADLLEVER